MILMDANLLLGAEDNPAAHPEPARTWGTPIENATMSATRPFLLTLILLISTCSYPANGQPYVNGRFQGRIAYSADGNHNDRDDWAASPVALAIFAEAGVKDQLVHFDYNCILPLTDPAWETIHADSVLGTAERYGYDLSRFHDCRKNLDVALASIARAINDSSADNPLYFIIAGPMEVPFRGIQQSEPAKRRFVYCISHSRWNDGFASRYQFTHTKRSVIEQDVQWVQIRDQNRLLSLSPYGRPAPPEAFAGFFWMRDSPDARVRFLWDRMVVSTRPDPSDAGMAYFLVTGDETCDPAKLKSLLADHRLPPPIMPRPQLRIEAENFRHLDNCVLDDRKDRLASHALNTKLAGQNPGRLRTAFHEPFAPAAADFDVEIRCFDETGKRSRFAFWINGVLQGSAWESAGEGRGWSSHTVRNVALRTGDELRVDVDGAPGRLDYMQLNLRQATDAAPATPKRTHSVFSVKPDHTGTLLNGHPFLAAGLRLSNGLISDAKTAELIAHLDEFASYGVNTISVFLQGSRFGDVRGYREDTSLDPVYAARLARIIEAADARGMVVLVGCLYHGDSKGWWRQWTQAQAEQAVANTVRWLKTNDYRNIFVDVNNEQMAKFDDAKLIAAGKAVEASYVIATSGKVTPANADLSIHHGSPHLPDKYYIETEGTGGNYWGSYSKQPGLYNYINIGVYTAAMQREMLQRTDAYLNRGQGYLFASTWLQCPPPGGPHHRPGGLGTPEDPGVRWWLKHLRARVGPYRGAGRDAATR